LITSKLYPRCVSDAFSGLIGWSGSRIKVMLLRDTYIFSPAHSNVSDVIEHEVSAVGYRQGGAVLHLPFAEQNGQAIVFHGGEGSPRETKWSNSTITARYVIIYDSQTLKLIAYSDLSRNMSSSSADFVVAWSSDGIFRISTN